MRAIGMSGLLAALVGCNGKGDDTGYSGADLWAEMDGYATWEQPNGWTGVRPSCTQDHAATVQVWANAAAMEAIAAGGGPFPDGAILVKESYADDGSLRDVTAMRKKDGFAPDAGDWYWGRFSPAGDPGLEGAVAACSGCHGGSGFDYSFVAEQAPVADAAECP